MRAILNMNMPKTPINATFVSKNVQISDDIPPRSFRAISESCNIFPTNYDRSRCVLLQNCE